MCSSRKYPYLPHGRLLEVPEGGGLEMQISKGCQGEKSNIFPEGPRALPDNSERTFQDNDLFLRSMHEHVLRTHFQQESITRSMYLTHDCVLGF